MGFQCRRRIDMNQRSPVFPQLLWKSSFFWVQRHFYPVPRCFPLPNQAKNENLGTSNWLPGRILCTEKVAILKSIGHRKVATGKILCTENRLPRKEIYRLLDLEGKDTLVLDRNYVSELRKMSSFTFKKMTDHDRLPFTFVCEKFNSDSASYPLPTSC